MQKDIEIDPVELFSQFPLLGLDYHLATMEDVQAGAEVVVFFVSKERYRYAGRTQNLNFADPAMTPFADDSRLVLIECEPTYISGTPYMEPEELDEAGIDCIHGSEEIKNIAGVPIARFTPARFTEREDHGSILTHLFLVKRNQVDPKEFLDVIRSVLPKGFALAREEDVREKKQVYCLFLKPEYRKDTKLFPLPIGIDRDISLVDRPGKGSCVKIWRTVTKGSSERMPQYIPVEKFFLDQADLAKFSIYHWVYLVEQ